MRVMNDSLSIDSTVALSANSVEQDISHLPFYSVTAAISSANPSNKAFTSADVSTGSDTITITAHGLLTGTKVTLTTSGVLPTGLAVLTDYYVIAASANTIKLATSQANALAGTAIDISGAGSGSSTVVITTTLAGSVKIQVNNEAEGETANWVDLPSSSTNFSSAGNILFNYDNAGYRAIRVVVTVTSGTVGVALRVNAKGA